MVVWKNLLVVYFDKAVPFRKGVRTHLKTAPLFLFYLAVKKSTPRNGLMKKINAASKIACLTIGYNKLFFVSDTSFKMVR